MSVIIRSVQAVFLSCLAGCVSLLPETAPPKPRYAINAVAADALVGGMHDWSLAIEDPRTTRVYDTVRIAVSTQPGKIEYFAGAEWADRAPRLLQSALVQSLEDSTRILTVGDRMAVPLSDFVLQSDIRRIQLNIRGGARTAVVSVYARLTDGRGKIYAARLFESAQQASSDDPDQVVAAFDAAFAEVIAGLANWTLDQGEAAKAQAK